MLKIHSGVGKPCVGKTELVVRTAAMSHCDKEWHRIALRWVTHSCHPVEPDCKREPPTAAQLLFESTKKPSRRFAKCLCERSVNVVHTHIKTRSVAARVPFSNQDSNLWNFTRKSASYLLVVRTVLCRTTSFSSPLPHDAKRESQKKRGTNLPHEFVVHVTETPIQAMHEETGT